MGQRGAIAGIELPTDAPSVDVESRRPTGKIDAGGVEIENPAAAVGGVERRRKAIESPQRARSGIAQCGSGAVDQRLGGIMPRSFRLSGLNGLDDFTPLARSRRTEAWMVGNDNRPATVRVPW